MSANRDTEEEIFDAARELAANERAAYLAEMCGQDADLRKRIEGMLEADAAAGLVERLASPHDAFAIVGAIVELASRQLRTGHPADILELEPVIERLVAGILEQSSS